MALIGRIIVIVVAVMLATVAAGIAIAMGLLVLAWQSINGNTAEGWTFSLLVVYGTLFAGAASLLPLVILIALAEYYKIRSFLIYALTGAAIMVAVYFISGLAPPSYEESIDNPPPPISRKTELVITAGVVFGGVYWLIAGRNAGGWREG